jgi:hypothetical protein
MGVSVPLDARASASCLTRDKVLRPVSACNPHLENVLIRYGNLATRIFCLFLDWPDLASPRSFRTADVGRESVIVIRGRDGALRAFLNVCL